MSDLLLASASPRRQELLDQIGVTYKILAVNIDETPLENELPEHYVRRVAAEKSAAAVAFGEQGLPVLAADTTVVLQGAILGKPQDQQHALEMLTRLSGKTHQVYSAISLRGRIHRQALSKTEVTFRQLTEREIINYWQTGEPADKAGAYAIQGLGGIFVKSIAGSFSGVVGLPLFETAEALTYEGIKIINE